MRTLIMLIVSVMIAVSCSGCLTLNLKLNESGLSFGLGADIPDIDYSYILE